LSSLEVEDVCGFEWRPRSPELDPAGDLAEVEILYPLGPLAKVALESVKEIARLVEDDELAARVEDPVNRRAFRYSRQGFGEERGVRVGNRGELDVQDYFPLKAFQWKSRD
jgi:hypothetical protein